MSEVSEITVKIVAVEFKCGVVLSCLRVGMIAVSESADRFRQTADRIAEIAS